MIWEIAPAERLSRLALHTWLAVAIGIAILIVALIVVKVLRRRGMRGAARITLAVATLSLVGVPTYYELRQRNIGRAAAELSFTTELPDMAGIDLVFLSDFLTRCGSVCGAAIIHGGAENVRVTTFLSPVADPEMIGSAPWELRGASTYAVTATPAPAEDLFCWYVSDTQLLNDPDMSGTDLIVLDDYGGYLTRNEPQLVDLDPEVAQYVVRAFYLFDPNDGGRMIVRQLFVINSHLSFLGNGRLLHPDPAPFLQAQRDWLGWPEEEQLWPCSFR